MYFVELYKSMNSKNVASSSVQPPLELPCEPDLLQLIKAFTPQLEKLGITITYEASQNSMVKVHTVPSCMLEKEVNEVKRGRKPVIAELVENLIREQMELCKQTRGASGALPKTLVYVLNSQACHGKIHL
ncbi:DNA mismatch repair protein Mlh3-like, partial [Limulus polyphemus]|uniref:DNA mismatch repair protein Mlh3-like n=1 Tax=Limulus polyphemus TaxID=6850 RepID=A0ABM1RZB6_LIMPO